MCVCVCVCVCVLCVRFVCVLRATDLVPLLASWQCMCDRGGVEHGFQQLAFHEIAVVRGSEEHFGFLRADPLPFCLLRI